MLGVVIVLSGVLAFAATGSVNYCGAKMCGNTNSHTFCQYPEGPSPKCVGYIEAKLNIQEKARLLERLNNRRNVAAVGRMRGFPAAGNMLKLRWVEELAREAQRWADQCRPPRPIEEHDTCRNLYSLTVGQCVASVVGESPGLRVESMVDIWYIQSMLYKGNVTFYVPPSNGSRYYGDFAQIIWAKSYMVGCARSRFMTPWQGRLRSVERLVCNIAPVGPPATQSLWDPGVPTSSCPYRSVQSSVWSGLCDYQRKQDEIVSLDPSTTLEDHLLLNTILEIEVNETLNYLGSIDEIYLTKLAIATLANTLKTKTQSNSKQRREVVDFVDVIEFHFNDSTIAFVPQVMRTLDLSLTQITDAMTTLPLQTEMTVKLTTPTQTENKLSLIGRISTHNMEDLTNFGGKTENVTKEKPEKENNHNVKYEIIGSVNHSTHSTISKDLLQTTEVPISSNVDKVSITTHIPEVSNSTSTIKVLNSISITEVSSSTKVTEVSNSTGLSGDLNSTEITEDSSTTDDYDFHTFTAVHPKLLEEATKLRFVTTVKKPEEQDDYDESDDPSGSGSDDDDDDDEGSGNSENSGDGERGGSGDNTDDGEGSSDDEGSDVRRNNRFRNEPNKMEDFDKYNSDPETVRQLQEALERIEHDLEPKKQNKRQKVRRELRQKHKDVGKSRKHWKRPHDNEEMQRKIAENVNPLIGFMKAVPSLAGSQGQSLGYSSTASCATPSLVIVLALCL